ncbi:hypothetical protein CH379_018820 [Leptospira ellisii]|nr:hypothetical protein [Leptospira ellisii]MDV6237689.1 hypothetical protein [Leptospira ellisii]
MESKTELHPRTHWIQDTVERCIQKLVKTFQENQDEFFFTEKDLQSYFFHCLLEEDRFIYAYKNRSHLLIHTEYPTPFKCIMDKNTGNVYPDFGPERRMRGHIDIIILNPNYIKWIVDCGCFYNSIYGLKNDLYGNYMPGMIRNYRTFNEEYGEPIIEYAIEFKFFRHTYSGKKYPLLGVLTDINKLKLFCNFKSSSPEREIHFAGRSKSIVFLGEKTVDVLLGPLREEEKRCGGQLMVVPYRADL